MAREPYEGTQIWFAGKAIHEELKDPTVALLFGRDALNSNKKPLRAIVWVRPGGTTNPAGQGGGLYRSPEQVEAEKAMVPTGKPVEAPAGTRVQFCYEPVDAAVAHLYAEDDLLLERLLYNLLAAIKLACGHHATPGRYVWPNELEGNLGKRQPKLELQVTFTFAAPEEISALTLITSAVHTHNFDVDADGTDDSDGDDEHD